MLKYKMQKLSGCSTWLFPVLINLVILNEKYLYLNFCFLINTHHCYSNNTFNYSKVRYSNTNDTT